MSWRVYNIIQNDLFEMRFSRSIDCYLETYLVSNPLNFASMLKLKLIKNNTYSTETVKKFTKLKAALKDRNSVWNLYGLRTSFKILS